MVQENQPKGQDMDTPGQFLQLSTAHRLAQKDHVLTVKNAQEPHSQDFLDTAFISPL